jgi:hypothetical protein
VARPSENCPQHVAQYLLFGSIWFSTSPLARTNSCEKVLPENDVSAATERSHQSMACPDLLPSSRSQCTEERSPCQAPSATTLSPSQRALSIVNTVLSEGEEALALEDGVGLAGAGIPPCWGGGSPGPTPPPAR